MLYAMNADTKSAYNQLHGTHAGYTMQNLRSKSNWQARDTAIAEASGLGSAIEQRRTRAANARAKGKAARASRKRNR